MRVLIGCEFSGTVRDAFRRQGWTAVSCDIRPSLTPGLHMECDVLEAIQHSWDLAIFHPPCTYLTNAAEWAYADKQKKRIAAGVLVGADRRAAREEAITFVRLLSEANIPHIAIENPVGVLSSRWRKPDQYIQPYEYGDDASKKTCLWLKNLPKLRPTMLFPPRLVSTDGGGSYTFRWSNQTDSGQSAVPPSTKRAEIRSVTYHGWADAMAVQWTKYIRGNDATG